MRTIALFLLFSLFLSCGKDNETQKQRFLIRGNEALKQQNYREAKRFYDEAINLDSCYAPAINNLGILAYEAGRYGEAVLSYDRSIDCDPSFLDAQINRANAFYELNELYRALDDLAYVEKQRPDTLYVHFMKGLVYTKMRKYEEALSAFHKTVALDSSNAEAWINRGSVYYYLGQLDKAETDLNYALQLDPLESNAYNALALVEIDRANYDQALEFVNKALDFEPLQPYFLNNRGFIYLMKDDFESAAQDINRSIALDPNNPWSFRNKGWYYFKTGSYEEAIRLLEQALKLDPYVTDGHVFLAKAYWAAGQREKACAELALAGISDGEITCP